MSGKKSFLKLGIIYAIGQILSKIIAFLLLPIYTRELGTVGYGQLALVDTVFDLISAFTTISIYSGYIRFYREYDGIFRNKLKNTAINFSICMSSIVLLFVVLSGKYIAPIIFDFENSYEILVLTVLRSIFFQFITLFVCDYSLRYEAKKVVFINLGKLISELVLIIYFVVVRSEGVIGVYKGYVVGNLLILIYLVLVNIKNYRLNINIKMLKKMLKFSGGLLPSQLSSTILNLSDRYFLSSYQGLSQTGIYSIGYKFGTLIEPLFVAPFKQIFTPYKFEIWKDDDAEKKFNQLFFNYHIIGCFVILAISLNSKLLITLFATKEYIDAYKIIPLILISYFLYGKSSFYCLGMHIKNKTYLDGPIMLSGGFLNIILNILLIPRWGMYGAAVATVISYVMMNFIYLKVSLPMYHIRYKYKEIVKIYVICVSLYIIYYMISIENLSVWIECLIGIVLLMSYIGLAIVFKIIKKSDVLLIYKYLLTKFFRKNPN
ncbi:oligosaccharide flippase family protein [Bacillus thuringiensis]|uniref:Polysaccharide biosynthesis protein C-terminal domain-containing protein n=1 Tax=Bacillus thuringiensis subsp. higo TaxID=132266 RepID=A0A9X6LVQ6_BACUH|nr:oligosaccharide flippase family protein [Bacillus thuringiensis]MED2785253.1 oligosaccharide flippase family protein [Bacillus thuringiensis]MED2807228.1 oligosaccharide flippase family protein [Bacillus thuringiensis]MED2825591.1 oligosaccharide flippase family protein [Bacillus thuringiensis]MED2831691.1 oligosaccharide flippase family protein [Bacillus thuringiensis]MED2847667.1 oligosaccharide flippase family protein [Bacillus thuringiensis]